MTYPIVLDIETQYKFQEVNYDHKKLKVSVVGIYDYERDTYEAFFEKDLKDLFPRLEHASSIIGFNIRKFDIPVLSPYYLGNISQFPLLDIMDFVEKALGYRVALDDLVRATLGTKKEGHGLLAIDYFREGKLQELKDYCLSDVRITRELYEYGKKHKKLYFQSYRGKQEIPVEFETLPNPKNSVSLSLPF